jgi:hypothetical protein
MGLWFEVVSVAEQPIVANRQHSGHHVDFKPRFARRQKNPHPTDPE